MRISFLYIICALVLAGATLAADPVAYVSHDAGRNTLTIEYDAPSVLVPPPSLLSVEQWLETTNPILFSLATPATLDTEHGSVSLLDPTSGAIKVVSVGMGRRSVLAGHPPPAFAAGASEKIRDKLRDEYSASVSDWMYLQRTHSTPAAVVQGLVADTPVPE